ncbi:response regulator [Paenibacillus sp. D2_2]|uniref:response regulator transcription factor n=1 Tax=Paenibacillus sp. D2_2 TaxID=3073092 RepID=UPI0028160298|nr:response regulator [Paenibacillus sp. D2_2]WMT39584.1 response regulator [Paenibacillus sp. D2_2]
MYRILIVDDELHVVEWIYELLGELAEIELDIYKANTVTEALNWLHRSRMDIVISDIAMPGMNGLELHTRIRRLWPACKVIFLTGYTDFEYAYHAVKEEAAGYILKTEDDDVILETVRRVVNGIEESLHRQYLLQQAENKLESAAAVLRMDYLLALLRGEPSEEQQRRENFAELDISLEPVSPVWLFITRFDGAFSSSVSIKPQLISVLEQMTGEVISARWNCYVAINTLDGIIWLLQGDRLPADGGLEPRKYLQESLERIQGDFYTRLDISLSMIVGDCPVDWENIASKQAELGQRLTHAMIYRQRLLLTEGGQKREQLSPSALKVDRSKIELLRIHLDKGQTEAFIEVLQELQLVIHDHPFLPQDGVCLEVFFGISTPLLAYINRWQVCSMIEDSLLTERLTKPELFASWEEVFHFLSSTAKEMFRLLGEWHDREESNIIRYVKEYMQSHLHTGVSLIELADKVYFNPSYLSRLFKETTGMSITDYLAQLRLERAIAMLGENCKISEIAAAVGIESPAYFSRFFRKMTNRTPQEYRELLLLGQGQDKE